MGAKRASSKAPTAEAARLIAGYWHGHCWSGNGCSSPYSKEESAKQTDSWLSGAAQPYSHCVSEIRSRYSCALIAGLLFIPTTIIDTIGGVCSSMRAHGLGYGPAVMRSATVLFGWMGTGTQSCVAACAETGVMAALGILGATRVNRRGNFFACWASNLSPVQEFQLFKSPKGPPGL